jgi:hypothetical protein
MSEATPVPVEPPTPSAEQLAEWRALIERIRQGERFEVVAWDEVAAAGTAAVYQVFATQRLHRRLRNSVAPAGRRCRWHYRGPSGDPIEASMIFRRRRLGDAGWMVTFGAAGGLLTYWVLPAERIVVLLDLTWAG